MGPASPSGRSKGVIVTCVGRILSTGQVADWQEHVGTVEVPTFVTAEAPRMHLHTSSGR